MRVLVGAVLLLFDMEVKSTPRVGMGWEFDNYCQRPVILIGMSNHLSIQLKQLCTNIVVVRLYLNIVHMANICHWGLVVWSGIGLIVPKVASPADTNNLQLLLIKLEFYTKPMRG